MELAPALVPLTPLLGRWVGGETLEASPWMPAGTAEATWRFAPGAGGTALIQDYQQRRDGQPEFVAHGVIAAAEPGSEQPLLSWWFDTFAFPPRTPSTARCEADGLVVITKRTERGTSVTTLAIDADGRLHQSIDLQLAGKDAPSPLMRGLYERTDE